MQTIFRFETNPENRSSHQKLSTPSVHYTKRVLFASVKFLHEWPCIVCCLTYLYKLQSWVFSLFRPFCNRCCLIFRVITDESWEFYKQEQTRAGHSFTYRIWQDLDHICAPRTQITNNERKIRCRWTKVVHIIFQTIGTVGSLWARKSAFFVADIHWYAGKAVLR